MLSILSIRKIFIIKWRNNKAGKYAINLKLLIAVKLENAEKWKETKKSQPPPLA